MISFCAQASLALLAVVPLVAEAQGDAATHAGTFTAKTANTVVGKALAAGPKKTAAMANADKLVAILKRDGALGNPTGYSVVVRPSVGARTESDPAAMPFRSAVYGRLTYLDKDSDNGTIGPTGESVDFVVAINAVGQGVELDADTSMIDHGMRMLPLDPDATTYRVTGQFRGRPVYNGECTYVTHRSVPPLIAVTRQRYLEVKILEARAEFARHNGQRAEISAAPSSNAQLTEFLKGRAQRRADNEKLIETVRTAGGDTASVRQMREAFDQTEAQMEAGLRGTSANGNDARIQALVDSGRAGETNAIAQLQAKLNAMSPAERAAPAMIVSHGRGLFELADADNPDAMPLWQPNPSFYDTTLAPEVPQLIWVCIPGLQGLEDTSYQNQAGDTRDQVKAQTQRKTRDAVHIRDGLDWAALEGMVRP
jgi:hypothetical protein